MSDIPTDIIQTHIFLKLPAKTLALLKCVCKSWQLYISSREFISLHLNYSLSLNRNHLLIVTTSKKSNYSLFSLPLPYSLPTPTKLPFPVSERDREDALVVAGCCDGLVCVGSLGNGFNVRVLNPSTGVYKDIIESLRLPRRVCGVVYGFGYDLVNDDYKVVRIFEYYAAGISYSGNICRQVSVCSLKQAEWRVLGWKFPSNRITDGKNGAVLEKHLVHWLFWRYTYQYVKKFTIKSFEICSEEWVNDVALPDDIGEIDTETRGHWIDLSAFDGYLCLSSLRTEQIDIWIMKDYGVQESWIKLLSVTDARVARSVRVAPVVYSGCRNNVLLSVKREDDDEHENQLCWYDLENGSIKVNEYLGIKNSISVDDCVGSLVCVPGGRPFVPSE